MWKAGTGFRLARVSRTRGALLLTAAALALIPGAGCYEHRSGNPVDAYHYEHAITVAPDLSHISVKTYLNRTHLQVGMRIEDLYDGDRDGQLTTPGMDRVQITDYLAVEDPPERAERKYGELRNYDELLRKILEAVRAGKSSIKIEDRNYRIRTIGMTTKEPSSRAMT